jgi:hypothetical protein
MQEQLIRARAHQIKITENRECQFCHKRLGSTYHTPSSLLNMHAPSFLTIRTITSYITTSPHHITNQTPRGYQPTRAFARYPNGVVVHYKCMADRTVCPVTGTKFSRQLPLS